MSSIEEELGKCFIPISGSNTEDEMFRFKMNKSDLDSDNYNNCNSNSSRGNGFYKDTKDKGGLGIGIGIGMKFKNNNTGNTNPNLVYKKQRGDSTREKNKGFTNYSNNVVTGNVAKNNTQKLESRNKSNSRITKNENSVRSITNNNNGNQQQNNQQQNNDLNIKNENLQLENESLNKKILETNKTLLQFRGEKIVLEDENAILKLEKEKSGSIKESQIATLNEKIMKLEIENSKLIEINDFSKKRLEEYNPKVFKYDELYSKYSSLLSESEKLSEISCSNINMLSTLKKDKEGLLSKFEVMRIENDALKNDKFYLSKENMSLSEKLLSCQDKIKVLEEDFRDLRKTNQGYLDKLTDKNLNIENSFEEKLRRELEDMKKKYEADKENLKRLFEELSEKRCSYLAEEKEEYKHKTQKYEKIIKDKEETIDFLNTEMRMFTKKTDEELSFHRIQLKIRSEDLERISNFYEENNNILKITKNENESLKDKNDLIRSELIRKEANYREEISEQKSKFSMLKEKINNYELIENELDKVIADSAVMSNNENEDNEVLSIIKDIPTSSKRRISQCLLLANKLKLSSFEMEKVKGMNKKLEENLSLITDERDLYRSVADKAKQPYSYLIKNLQEMEIDLYRKSASLEEKDQSVKSLLRENEMLNEKLKTVETDMKVVLNNRKKLDNLEDIIGKFIKSDGDNFTEGKFFNNFNSTVSNPYHNNSVSTKYNTNANINNLNMFTPNNNKELLEIPERDSNNRTNINNNYNNNNNEEKIPKWYMNLKMRNGMK